MRALPRVAGAALRVKLALKRLLYATLPDSVLNGLVRRRLPRAANLEATTACNLECLLCPTHIVPRRTRFLEGEHVQNVLESCAGALETVCFHIDGEPLVHRELFDFVRRCSAAGVTTRFSTNGMLIDQYVDELLESGLSFLSIAIDGIDGKDYERYRRRGDFDLVVRNTKALLAERHRRGQRTPIVQVQTIMFSYNEEREREVRSFLDDLGADEVCLKHPSYFGDLEGARALGIDVEAPAFARAMSAADEFREGVRHEDEDLRYSRPTRTRPEELFRNQRMCPQLEKGSVLSDGRVVACCMDVGGVTTFGDLRDASFAEIWAGEAHRTLLDRFLKRELDICRHCTLSTRL